MDVQFYYATRKEVLVFNIFLITFYFSLFFSKEVCHPDIGGKIIMCPQCDKLCPFWKLNITCESSKVIFIFPNI